MKILLEINSRFPFAGTNSGSIIFTDVGAASSIEVSEVGGGGGNLVKSTDTSQNVGLIFYDYGIAVLDLVKITILWQLFIGDLQYQLFYLQYYYILLLII